MKKQLLFAIALTLSLPAFALETPSPRDKAESFFADVQKGDLKNAYARLFKGSTIGESKPETLEIMKTQTEKLNTLYGGVLGIELSFEEAITSSVSRLIYVQKHEKHAIVWEFYFYKPKDLWLIANLNFNDQFNLLDRKQ